MDGPFLTRGIDRTRPPRPAQPSSHFEGNAPPGVRSKRHEGGGGALLLGPVPSRCYSRFVLAGDVVMGTDVLEFIYLVCFFLGLGFAVLSALLSGVFSGHIGPHMDVGGAHVNMGGIHTDGTHVGPTDGTVHYQPLSPVSIALFVTTFGGVGL